jgi:hypothetical protein
MSPKISALVLACLLVGCVATTGEDTSDDSGSAIVGGADDDGHPSTALIRFVKTDDGGKTRADNCTGSLVAPDIVLTAAHCVVGSTGRRHSGWKVSFEATTDDGELVNPIDVERGLPHPEFRGAFGRFDVALLYLKKRPQGRTPMKLVESLGDISGEKVTFVGYGAIGASPDGDELVGGNDRRRAVTVRVSEVSSTFIEYTGSKGLCGGDSGGPTLLVRGGKEVIVGINDLSGAGCSGNGASLRIDDESDVRDFLAEHLSGVSQRQATPEDPCDGCERSDRDGG